MIDQKASEAMIIMTGQKKQALDPTVISQILNALAGAIVMVIQAIAQCVPAPTPTPTPSTGSKSPVEAAAVTMLGVVNSPGLLHKIRLGIICRAQLNSAGVALQYQYLAPGMRDALVAVGGSTTAAELTQAVQEALSVATVEGQSS